MFTLNCKGRLLVVDKPIIMGIINLTPDSFYAGSRFNETDAVLHQAEKMLNEGADFIDVGAYSSKPNAEFVSEEEEISRIIPVVNLLQKHFPETILSIDTFRAEVAKVCIENGASIINDISAGKLDNKMLQTIAKYQVRRNELISSLANQQVEETKKRATKNLKRSSPPSSGSKIFRRRDPVFRPFNFFLKK